MRRRGDGFPCLSPHHVGRLHQNPLVLTAPRSPKGIICPDDQVIEAHCR